METFDFDIGMGKKVQLRNNYLGRIVRFKNARSYFEPPYEKEGRSEPVYLVLKVIDCKIKTQKARIKYVYRIKSWQRYLDVPNMPDMPYALEYPAVMMVCLRLESRKDWGLLACAYDDITQLTTLTNIRDHSHLPESGDILIKKHEKFHQQLREAWLELRQRYMEEYDNLSLTSTIPEL